MYNVYAILQLSHPDQEKISPTSESYTKISYISNFYMFLLE